MKKLSVIILMLMLLQSRTLIAQVNVDEVVKAVRSGDMQKLAMYKQQSVDAGERFFISAVLEKDGTVAKLLYESALAQPLNPIYKQICSDRLSEYNNATTGITQVQTQVVTPVTPKPPIVEHDTLHLTTQHPISSGNTSQIKTLPPPQTIPSASTPPVVAEVKPPTVSSQLVYGLQFGSFIREEYALELVKKLKGKALVKILSIKDNSGNTLYKVRTSITFKTHDEAQAYGAKIYGISSFVVELPVEK